MNDPVPQARRKFSAIQADLDAIAAKLKTTNDPNLKRDLLREMSILLREATLAANSFQEQRSLAHPPPTEDAPVLTQRRSLRLIRDARHEASRD